MHILPGNAQAIGQRHSQQDEFWFSDIHDHAFIAHGGVLALVADGMGGLEKGDEASRLAARTFGTAYLGKRPKQNIPDALLYALQQANTAVCELSLSVDAFSNVGTTLTAAVIAGQSLFWLSVGDSRLYLYRQGELTQLTHDHNYGELLQEQVAEGRLSPASAANDPERNALTSYVGLPDIVLIDRNIRAFPLEADDWLLLCSDGLYGYLSHQEITDELFGSPQEAADSLIQRLLEQNHPQQDNVTVVIMGCPAATPPPPPAKKQAKRPARAGWLLPLLGSAIVAAGWIAKPFLLPATPAAPPALIAPAPAALAQVPEPPAPAADTPSPTNEDARIAELMAQAAADSQADRLTTGQNGNALEKYRQILALRPQYEPAKTALSQMAEQLLARAEQAKQAGDVAQAQKRLEEAGQVQLTLDPNNKANEAQRRLAALRSAASPTRKNPAAAAKPAPPPKPKSKPPSPTPPKAGKKTPPKPNKSQVAPK